MCVVFVCQAASSLSLSVAQTMPQQVFFGPAAHAAQNEKLQKEREERKGGGQITVLSFLWRRQGSANHNQAINLSLIRHQMTLKAA